MATINTPTGWGEWWKTKRGELVDGTKNEVSEALNIPQELKDYRKAWKERINLSDAKKEEIIKAVEQIPVNVEIDGDWSKLIEFKLWGKLYKILNPKLDKYTDGKYRYNYWYLYGDWKSGTDTIERIDTDYVILWWMWRDDADIWNNQKLKEYVKQKEWEWLYIPKIEEMKDLLMKLWEKVGMSGQNRVDEQIAMLMYLTGMNWWYWLTMWNDKRSGSIVSRTFLSCIKTGYRSFWASYDKDNMCANLCMISCE